MIGLITVSPWLPYVQPRLTAANSSSVENVGDVTETLVDQYPAGYLNVAEPSQASARSLPFIDQCQLTCRSLALARYGLPRKGYTCVLLCSNQSPPVAASFSSPLVCFGVVRCTSQWRFYCPGGIWTLGGGGFLPNDFTWLPPSFSLETPTVMILVMVQ